MYRPTLPLLLALLPAVSWAQEDTPAGVSFYHRDWQLACDNTRTCRAAGYHSDSDELPTSVLLTRKAGPQQAVTGQLKLAAYFDNGSHEQLPKHFRVTMSIDGEELGEVKVGGDDWQGELSPRQVEALLAVLPRSSDIRWQYRDLEWHLSDSGAAAVLLKMDDVQGRVGTPGALIRKGNRSEGDVPAPLAKPVVSVAALAEPQADDAQRFSEQQETIRAALREIGTGDECFGLIENDAEAPPLSYTRLTASQWLVSTTCWSGAYNIGEGYWVINDNPPYQPVQITESASDFSHGIITAGQKDRGLGDCWHSNSWAWDGQRFVLIEAMSTGLCKGFAGGAWELPELAVEVR